MADNPTLPLTGAGDPTAKVRTKDLGEKGHLQLVGQAGPSTAGTPTQVSVSASVSTVLLPANDERAGIVITNESGSAFLYVRFGGAATAALYTYAIAPGVTLTLMGGIYTGDIQGRLGAGSSTAMAQEFTW